jgi:hypothetical protein
MKRAARDQTYEKLQYYRIEALRAELVRSEPQQRIYCGRKHRNRAASDMPVAYWWKPRLYKALEARKEARIDEWKHFGRDRRLAVEAVRRWRWCGVVFWVELSTRSTCPKSPLRIRAGMLLRISYWPALPSMPRFRHYWFHDAIDLTTFTLHNSCVHQEARYNGSTKRIIPVQISRCGSLL